MRVNEFGRSSKVYRWGVKLVPSSGFEAVLRLELTTYWSLPLAATTTANLYTIQFYCVVAHVCLFTSSFAQGSTLLGLIHHMLQNDKH